MENQRPLTREDVIGRELAQIEKILAAVGRQSTCPFFTDPTEPISERVRHLADECSYLAVETGAYIPEPELEDIKRRLVEDHKSAYSKEALNQQVPRKSPFGVN